MDKYLNQQTVGQFIINNELYFGEINLNGSDSTLTIYLNVFVPEASRFEYPTQVHGTLYDLTKVTLIDMSFLGVGGNNKQNSDGSYERSQYLKFDLHYVVFGDTFIYEDTSYFHSIEFTLPDSNTLFNFNSFTSIIHSSKTKALKLIEEDIKESQLKYGFSKDHEKYEFGDRPEIYIYTGEHILKEFQVPYGSFKLRNHINSTLPSNRGFIIDNTIVCLIEFKESNKFWEILKTANPIIQLSELIMGRKQIVNTYKLEVKNDNSVLETYDVYQTKIEKRNLNNPVHPLDRLIHVETEANEFENLLNNWLLRQEEWKFARNEFFSVFRKRLYNSDTLIKVANLYDIIPDNAYQKSELVSEEVLEAKRLCKEIFKNLPISLERNSILGALGRIGNKSLKHKIRDRYLIIENSGFTELTDINLVIGHAVDCRNFYVHGGIPKFDYSVNFNEVYFFIDTLLFIYGASEMIELGWKFTNWKPDILNAHPFSLYLNSYKNNLSNLEKVLTLERADI